MYTYVMLYYGVLRHMISYHITSYYIRFCYAVLYSTYTQLTNILT